MQRAISLFCVFTLLIIAVSAGAQAVSKDTSPNLEAKEKPNPYANAELTITIIPSVNSTYGYDILVHGRPLVHQPGIPGLPGNEGFRKREYAQKVAELVLKKIRNNEMPPTVTLDELNSMGVLK